ncbi:hypothetical protein TWF506_004411 [Arthrobotrys conoides]|uniref:BTB domain-containing protein n=1 Tax=Arthrobotrys conoides TaxID=74498 RepID=A0AAN8RPI7_9PEZI
MSQIHYKGDGAARSGANEPPCGANDDSDLAEFAIEGLNLEVLREDAIDWWDVYERNPALLASNLNSEATDRQANIGRPIRRTPEQQISPLSKSVQERKQEFWKVTEDTTFTDMLIIAGTDNSRRSFHMHRVIFNQYSGWLMKLHNSHKSLLNKREISLRVRNIDGDIFELVKAWMYLKEGVFNNLPIDNASRLLAAAEALEIPKLKYDLLWFVYHELESKAKPGATFLTGVFNFLNLAFRIKYDDDGDNLVVECLRKLLSKCSIHQINKYWASKSIMCDQLKEQFQKFINTTKGAF